MEKYWSLKRDTDYTSEIVIERSRFLGYARMVETPGDAQQYIKTIKQKHSDARHVVYAYRLFGNSKSTDDGEPSGTAGRPILEYLGHKDIYNVVMVVVRYFGGIKLGTGGLVRAYTNSAVETLRDNLVEWREINKYSFETDYSGYQNILGWAKNKDVRVLDVDYQDTVTGVIYTLKSMDMPDVCKYIGKDYGCWSEEV